MKYLKFILFIIIAGVFVLSLYVLLADGRPHSADFVGTMFFGVIFIIAIITGKITLVTLYKSSKTYLYFFLIALSIPLLFIIISEIKYTIVSHNNTWPHQLKIQRIEIWENINNPKKVETLLKNAKKFKFSNHIKYKYFKASVYFGLSKHDENYYTKYENFIKDNDLDKCMVVKEFLRFNVPKTEEDYLQFFKALGDQNQDYGPDFTCYFTPNYYPDTTSLSLNDFLFKNLYVKGYKKAALKALNKTTDRPNYYIEQFKEIDDLDYYNKAFIILIENTDFSNFHLNDFYKFILNEKKSTNFENYLSPFSKKINTLNFEKTGFVNQEEQPLFIELYSLLGKNHSFIKAFPKEYVKKQIQYQKETKGKPFIHFVQFYSQSITIEHLHPYEDSYFYIKHNKKLIYKGITNKYGCISYKNYNLKPTDTIEVSFGRRNYKKQIGWQQLLPAWNTEKGAKEHFYAMGHYPKYENIYQQYGNGTTTFNLEIAKKIKTDFDNYFDKKWH